MGTKLSLESEKTLLYNEISKEITRLKNLRKYQSKHSVLYNEYTAQIKLFVKIQKLLDRVFVGDEWT